MPQPNNREKAAKLTFDEIVEAVRKSNPSSPFFKESRPMSNYDFANLLDKNFSRLDPDSDGITRDEIAQAVLSPWDYNAEEFTMLKILQKYFDTIANMVDDEPGVDTRITLADKEVLNQFLRFSGLDMQTLEEWRSADTSIQE